MKRAGIHNYLPGWVDQLANRGLMTCGYVMMPNHLHLLLYVDSNCKGFNRILGDSKLFMAYEIVSRLKKLNETVLLEKLISGVQENEKLKRKKHQVFRLSFDAKEVVGDESINKVLDYIYHNPVNGGW